MLRIADRNIDTKVYGFESISFTEVGGPPQISDFNPRKRAVRALVFHTTKGSASKLLPGAGPRGRANVYAQYQVKTDRMVSWDGTIDCDGTLLWQNDPAKLYSWHATAWNSISLGVEIVESAGGVIYEAQIRTAGALADIATGALGFQRQLTWDAHNNVVTMSILPRADEHGKDKGATLSGVFGHYHNTKNRSVRDPYRFVFDALKAAGYECFDMIVRDGAALAEDQKVWMERQRALSVAADGLPLVATRAALRAAGNPLGMWTPRPNDDYLVSLGF